MLFDRRHHSLWLRQVFRLTRREQYAVAFPNRDQLPNVNDNKIIKKGYLHVYKLFTGREMEMDEGEFMLAPTLYFLMSCGF